MPEGYFHAAKLVFYIDMRNISIAYMQEVFLFACVRKVTFRIFHMNASSVRASA